MGSQHYLLGLLADEGSVAARALAALGVTSAAIEERLGELDVAGTSDELPEQAGARRLELGVSGSRVAIFLDEPELAAALSEALAGRQAEPSGDAPGPGGPKVTGADPAAAGFPELWLAVRRGVDDVLTRLGHPIAETLEPSAGGLMGAIRKHLSILGGTTTPGVTEKRSPDQPPPEPSRPSDPPKAGPPPEP